MEYYFCQLQLLRSIIEQLTVTIGAAIAAQGNIKGISLYKSILDSSLLYSQPYSSIIVFHPMLCTLYGLFAEESSVDVFHCIILESYVI